MEVHMKRTFLVGAAIAAAMLFCGSASAQNLITEGDFEGCIPPDNWNNGFNFVVDNPATHGQWIDVDQWVCAAEDIITGSDGQFAQQTILETDNGGSNNLLFQGFLVPPELSGGGEVRLCFDYINEDDEGQNLDGLPEARIYAFRNGATLERFAPWNITGAPGAIIAMKDLNENQPVWLHDTLDANIVAGTPALAVAFLFGYQGAATYPSGDLHGVDNVELVSLPVAADLNIDPDTLNPKSQGNFITAYIGEFDGCFDPGDINPSSVELTEIDGVPITPLPAVQWDLQDGVLMVKFSRPDLIAALIGEGSPDGIVTLTVEGDVDGSSFSAEDDITVLAKYPN